MATVQWTVSLYILAVVQLKVSNGANAYIEQLGSGIVGTNDTSLVCNFTRENVNSLNQVEIEVEMNNTLKLIVIYYPGDDVYIQPDGLYLKERVTFENITKSSHKTVLHFKKLLCLDENDYICTIKYTPENKHIGDNGEVSSLATHLFVRVSPNIPDNITFIKNEFSNFNGTSTRITKKRKKDVVTVNPIHPNVKTDKILKEGDSISILCEGSVGRPAGTLLLQKIQSDGERYNLTAESYHTVSENCSFYQNSSFNVNLTAKDNGAVFRCAEMSLRNKEEKNIELGPMDIKYGVRPPDIIEYYLLKPPTPPLYLSCNTSGNPLPEYSWYKARNTSEPDRWEFYADTQNINLTNHNDSGVYRCDAKNSIGKQGYWKRREINITFEASKTTMPTENTTPEINGKGKSKDDEELLHVIIGVITVVVVILIIVVVYIIRRKKSAQHKTSKNQPSTDKSDSRLVHQPSRKQTVGSDNYHSVSLDNNEDNGGSGAEKVCTTQDEIRKHNEIYLKKQEEADARNVAQGPHQAVEYATVTKGREKFSSQRLENKKQSTECTQVDKLKKEVKQSLEQTNEDHYATGHEIYDHTNNRRHRQSTESNPYDTTTSINSERSDKAGSVSKTTGEPTKQKQVAKVKPSGRDCYENAAMELYAVIKTEEPIIAV